MKKIQHQAHDVRYREKPKDKYYTPEILAAELVKLVPLVDGDMVLDPCSGKGAFINNYPAFVVKHELEIDKGQDFFKIPLGDAFDWVVTNPPYSNLNEWLLKIMHTCRKGFALLLAEHAITPKRLDMLKDLGFGITKMHYVKVMQWYGLSVFIVVERNKEHLISYTRKIYQAKID